MNCIACHTDRESHSNDLWKLHQQPRPCTFCNRSSSEHSETLWEVHKAAVEKGQFCTDHKKKEKLYPITVGFSGSGIARVCRTNADPPHDVELVPIYMSCTECGLYLGSIEEDHADLLGCMCLECFREATGQLGDWCDSVPVSAKSSQTDIERSRSKDTLIKPEEEKNC